MKSISSHPNVVLPHKEKHSAEVSQYSLGYARKEPQTCLREKKGDLLANKIKESQNLGI